MHKKKLWNKILSGVLCAALLLQGLSVPVSAEELTVTETAAEDVSGNTPEEEASGGDISGGDISDGDISGCDVSGPDKEPESSEQIIPAEDAAHGCFTKVEGIDFKGYNVYINSVEYTCTAGNSSDVQLYLEEYDKNDKLLTVSGSLWATSTGDTLMSYPFYRVLLNETASIKLKAVERDPSTSKETTVYYDQAFKRPENRPNVTFARTAQEAESCGLSVTLKKSGKLYCTSITRYTADFIGGTTKKSSSWTKLASTSFYVNDSDSKEEQTIFLQNLEADTTYYGQLHIYIQTQSGTYVYEQLIDLDALTTLSNDTINLSEAFPDEVLRAFVLEALSNQNSDFSGDTATMTQLQNITSLHEPRSSLKDPAIRDLTGLEYLTRLDYLNLVNHEISDIRVLTGLKCLRNAYLNGNDISEGVDFSASKTLTYLQLDQNLLSKEDYTAIYASLGQKNTGMASSYAASRQRLDPFSLLAEDTYYEADGKVTLYVIPAGYKSGLDYTLRFVLNGEDAAFTPEPNNYQNLYRYETALAAGSENTLTLEYYDGENLLASKSVTFTIEEQELFYEECYGVEDADHINFSITDMVYDRTVSNVVLIDSSEKIVAVNYYDRLSKSAATNDERYQKLAGDSFFYAPSIKYARYNINLYPVCNLPVGDYSLKLTYSDGQEKLLKDLLHILPKDSSLITSCYSYTGADNVSEYLYALLRGSNIAGDQITYTLKDNYSFVQNLTYVSSKKTLDGIIVKLKKEKDLPLNSDYTLYLESDTIKILKNSCRFSPNKTFYYAAFNPVTQLLEAGFSGVEDGTRMDVEFKQSYSSSSQSLGITGNGTLKDGIAYIALYDAEGNRVSSLTKEFYYVQATVDGSTYLTTMNCNGSNYASASWSACTNPKASSYFYYTSLMPYDTETAKVENYRFETDALPDKTLSGQMNVDSSNGQARISITSVDFSSLSTGTYPIRLYYKDALLHSSSFTIVDESKFVINSLSVSKLGNLERVYIGTPDIADYEKLNFTFRDCNGTVIQDVTLTDKTLYTNGGYLFFEGLEEYKIFYLYVEHQEKGSAYTQDASRLYFSNESGTLMLANPVSIYSINQDKRMIGFMIASRAFPATIKVYRLYDTEALTTTITITADDCVNDDHYYFTRDFINQLPEKDGYYQVLVEDANGKLITSEGVLGCQSDSGADDGDKDKIQIKGITLNKSSLQLTEGKEDGILTATMTPVDAMNNNINIRVSSSNENVAAAAVSEKTTSGAKISITPVASGTAVLTVSINGTDFSDSCTIQVNKALDLKEEQAKISNLYAFLNTADGKAMKLQDVALPEDFSWVDGDIVLTADDAMPVQFFKAVITREGYEPAVVSVPVYIGKMTGLELIAVDEGPILKGCSAQYVLSFQGIGYLDPDIIMDHVTIDYTVSKNLSIHLSNNDLNVELIAGDVSKVSKESIKATATLNGKTKFTASKTVIVQPEKSVNQITVKAAEVAPAHAVAFTLTDSDITLDAAAITPKKADVIALTADSYIDSEEKDTALTWKIADTRIAAVQTDKFGRNAQITVKNAGKTTITVTAKDSGAYTKTLTLDVQDFAPMVENSKLTLNQYLTDGITIPCYVRNQNKLTDAALYTRDKTGTKTALTDLKVTLTDRGELQLTTDKEWEKNTVYKDVILSLSTQNGSIYDYRLTVTIDTKKPAVKLIQKDKLNLFYCDSPIEFFIKTDADIADVTMLTTAAENEPTLYVAAVAPSANCFLLATRGLNAQNKDAFKKNGLTKVLRITFSGYKESAAQEVTVKVASENKPAKYTLTDVKFAENMNLSTTIINAVTKKPENAVFLKNCTLSVKKPVEGLTAVLRGNTIDLSYDGNKSVSYELVCTSPDWTQPVVLKGKLNALKQAEPLLSTKEILLNTEASLQKCGYVKTGVSFAGNDAAISAATFSGKNDAAASLLKTGALSLKFNSATQEIEAGYNAGYTIKAGSYAYLMKSTVTTENGSVPVKDKLITIKIVDGTKNKVKLTVTGKGAINVVAFNDTNSIVYTPKLTNMSAEIVGATLTGNFADSFEVQVVDGKIVVSCSDYAYLSIKTTYKLTLHVTLSNGYEGVSTQIKIKPVAKYPKVTPSVSKGTLYKATDSSISFSYNVSNNTMGAKPIVCILAEDKTDTNRHFLLTQVDGQQYQLRLADSGQFLTAGKTYNVTIQVLFDRDAYDAKPQTFKLAVTVK